MRRHAPRKENIIAFPAIAALAAGAEVTAALVLSAAAEIGITMTVVGAAAGSEDLMRIGAAMGLIGGLGGMIAGAGTAAAGEAAAGALSDSAADAAMNAASDEAIAASAADMALGETVGQAQLAQLAGSQGIVSSPVNLSPMPQASPIGPATNTMGNMAEAVPQVQADPLAVQAPQGAQAPVGPQAIDAPASPADINTNPTDMRLAANQQRTPDGPLAPSDPESFFGGFSAWAEKNKTLFNSGQQLLGGALKGMNERDVIDQKLGFVRDQWNRGNSVGTFQPRGIVTGAVS